MIVSGTVWKSICWSAEVIFITSLNFELVNVLHITDWSCFTEGLLLLLFPAYLQLQELCCDLWIPEPLTMLTTTIEPIELTGGEIIQDAKMKAVPNFIQTRLS